MLDKLRRKVQRVFPPHRLAPPVPPFPRQDPHSPYFLSPWRQLLLPCALETFAELSLWNTASYTRLSILYALLAKSAHHLHESGIHDTQQASRWRDVAASHRNDAQRHLGLALKTEAEGEDRAKYTELLMAILGVGFVSVSLPRDDTQRKDLLYKEVIDAERLIRLRGFPSRKSFGLRTLHHMYTHLGIIMESTNSSSVTLTPGVGVSPAPNPVSSLRTDRFRRSGHWRALP